MDSSNLINELAASGWHFSDSLWDLSGLPPSAFTFHKMYLDGVDVVVSLHECDGSYHVLESTEHRLPGPCITTCGQTNVIAGAYQLILNACRFRDR